MSSQDRPQPSPAGDGVSLRQRLAPFLAAAGIALAAGWAATRRAAVAFGRWWAGTGWPRMAQAWRTDLVRLRRWSVDTGRPRAASASRRTGAVIASASRSMGSASRRTVQVTATASRATASQGARGWSALYARQWPVLRRMLLRVAVIGGLAVVPPPRRAPGATVPAGRLAGPAPTAPTWTPTTDPRPVRGPVWLAARLGGIAIGGLAGVVGLTVLASAVSRPALSNATEVLDVRLDIPENASLPALDERSVIYDGDDNVLAVVDREVSRRSLPLRRIPKLVRNAVVTAEDRKFWEHDGYDIEGIGRAAVANIRAGGVEEGGSTITQQLAKSAVGQDRTIERKLSELLYAVALEERFTKDELLERYLNQTYFGARAYGVDAAAEEFFQRSVSELKPQHAALMAAMIRSPNTADPRDRPVLARKRRNLVLRAMVEEGYLKRRRLPKLLKSPLGVVESRQRAEREPHVLDATRRELLTLEALGKTPAQRERALYYGGLRITTTLDREMQQDAEETIAEYLPYDAPTGAIASVEPGSGEIKAIASGLGYTDLEYDLSTQGRRQPGSSFKPFVYAEALREGFPLEMALSGRSPAYFEGVPQWSQDAIDDPTPGVQNYGGASYGTLDMPSALQNSVNTAAAQLTIIVGEKRVVRLADRMGIDMAQATGEDYGPAIGLGGLTFGTTPLEMASAYAVFANEGKRVRPHLIAKVTDARGKVLYKAKPKPERVLKPVVNAAMVEMMRGVVTGGTGTGAALPSWEVAGKTGTTTDNADAWFVGYTPVLSTAVWMGHAEGQVEMPGMTGGSTPASIWQAYMGRALEGREVESFPSVDLAALDEINSRPVTVPDVRIAAEADALSALGERMLIGQVQVEDSYSPAGSVLWQSPAPGSSAGAGDTVYLGVSSGTPPPPPKPEPEPEPEPEADAPEPDDGGGDGGGGGGAGGGGGGGGAGDEGGGGGGEGGGGGGGEGGG